MKEVVDLPKLLQRLSVLEAERDILGTLYRYGQENAHAQHAHGKGEAHDNGVRYSGIDALRSFVETHTSAPQMWHKHLLIEPRISRPPTAVLPT